MEIKTINQLAKYLGATLKKVDYEDTSVLEYVLETDNIIITIKRKSKYYSAYVFNSATDSYPHATGTYSNQKNLIISILETLLRVSKTRYLSTHTSKNSEGSISNPVEHPLYASDLLDMDYIATQVARNRVVLSYFSGEITHRYIISYSDFKAMQKELSTHLESGDTCD